VPRFVVDLLGVDPARASYIADAEDQPFEWDISGLEFAPPPERYRVFVLLERGADPPLWLGTQHHDPGEEGPFSLSEELVAAKAARVRAQSERYRAAGFARSVDLERQIATALAGGELLELIAAGDALELAHARWRPINGEQRMGSDVTRMYLTKPDRFRRFLRRLFDYATVTFYTTSTGLEDFEPTEGAYEFASRDLLVHHLERLGMGIEGRPLMWLHSMVAPEWLAAKGFDGLQEYLRRHVPAVVGHYRGRIDHWEVVNEAHDWGDVLHLDHAQLIEAARLACELTRATDPTAQRVISGTEPFGIYASTGRREDGSRVEGRHWTPYTYFRDLIAADVPFETIGVQIYVPYRDLTDMVEMLDRIEALGKPVVITELGVPGAPIKGDITHAWTWEQQADWAERMYTLLMSRPNIAGILWYDLTDQWAFLPSGGLLDELSHPKPAYERIERLFVAAGRIPEAPPPPHRAGAGFVFG
jgi:GH35 family endo-1,4-beta-xylanase